MPPGHEGSTRWRADRESVIRLQSYALVGQAVDVRGAYRASSIAEVGVSEVICNDQHDVGLFGTAGIQAARDGEPGHQKDSKVPRCHCGLHGSEQLIDNVREC